jgi:hypothetical protein
VTVRLRTPTQALANERLVATVGRRLGWVPPASGIFCAARDLRLVALAELSPEVKPSHSDDRQHDQADDQDRQIAHTAC